MTPIWKTPLLKKRVPIYAPHTGMRARALMRRIMPVLFAAWLSACGSGSDTQSGLSQPYGSAAIAPAAPAPIVKMMRIDKGAYPSPPPRSDKTRIIGLLLPLSDERDTIRALAGHLYNGAQLALFDAPLDISATNLVISLHDTKGTPAGAQDAAKAAIAAGADVIVGPLFSSSVAAIQPVLAGRDVPGFAFSNDASTAMDGLWLLGFLPEQNIDRIVSEAIAQGLTRFGALVPEGVFGERIGASFAASVDRFGGTIVQAKSIHPMPRACLIRCAVWRVLMSEKPPMKRKWRGWCKRHWPFCRAAPTPKPDLILPRPMRPRRCLNYWAMTRPNCCPPMSN